MVVMTFESQVSYLTVFNSSRIQKYSNYLKYLSFDHKFLCNDLFLSCYLLPVSAPFTYCGLLKTVKKYKIVNNFQLFSNICENKMFFFFLENQ